MNMIANCIALAAAGMLAAASGPAGAVPVQQPGFDPQRPIAFGTTETASIFALQDRSRARSAKATRAAPSRPKPQARSNARSSVNHTDRNTNRINRERSSNRNNNNRYTNVSNNNVNVNVDRDVHYDDHHHHDHWDDWDDDWHPWATAAAVTMTAAVVGSIVASIPPDCSTVVVNGISYSQCGSTWYQPQYYGSSVQYVVVNPPR